MARILTCGSFVVDVYAAPENGEIISKDGLDYLVVHDNTGIVYNHNGTLFGSRLKTQDEKLIRLPGGMRGLPLDDKFDLLHEFQPLASLDQWSRDFGMVIRTNAQSFTGGGGAFNVTMAAGTFANGHINGKTFREAYDIQKIKAVFLHGNSIVRKMLPESVEYNVVCENDAPGTNLVLNFLQGEKVIFRQPVATFKRPDNDWVGDETDTEDSCISMINSVKDPGYVDYLEHWLCREKDKKTLAVVLSDSMIRALRHKVISLIAGASIYVSNISELGLLAGEKITETSTLVQIMRNIGRPDSMVFITLGPNGAIAKGPDGNVYFQPTVGVTDPIDGIPPTRSTNRGGDTFAGILLCLAHGPFSVIEILNYSTAAGQLLVTSGILPTPDSIKRFREDGNPKIRIYDGHKFVNHAEVVCRF